MANYVHTQLQNPTGIVRQTGRRTRRGLHPRRATGGDRNYRDVDCNPPPGPEQGRENARMVNCASNMRQLGMAFRMYVDGSNGPYSLARMGK